MSKSVKIAEKIRVMLGESDNSSGGESGDGDKGDGKGSKQRALHGGGGNGVSEVQKK